MARVRPECGYVLEPDEHAGGPGRRPGDPHGPAPTPQPDEPHTAAKPPPLPASPLTIMEFPFARRVWKAAYLALSVTGGLGVLVLACLVASYVPESLPVIALLMLLTPCSLGVIAAWMVLVYRAWGAIQDGHARASPATAVLRLFAPGYNAYWLFQAVVGFARDYNSLAERHCIDGVRMDVTLCEGWCVCALLTPVPYVGIATGLCVLALTPLLMADMCNAINAIADAQMGIGIRYMPPPGQPDAQTRW